jgi:hypothetical protein
MKWITHKTYEPHLITGSSDGLGLMSAQLLVEQVHSAFAMARRLPEVFCHAMTPGWVPTRSPGANDDLDQAHRTQVWLAVSADPGRTRLRLGRLSIAKLRQSTTEARLQSPACLALLPREGLPTRARRTHGLSKEGITNV